MVFSWLVYGTCFSSTCFYGTRVFFKFFKVQCKFVLKIFRAMLTFLWSTIWCLGYHKLHIWLWYDCQEKFMMVNLGSHTEASNRLVFFQIDLNQNRTVPVGFDQNQPFFLWRSNQRSFRAPYSLILNRSQHIKIWSEGNM